MEEWGSRMHADDTNYTVVKNGVVVVSGTGPAIRTSMAISWSFATARKRRRPSFLPGPKPPESFTMSSSAGMPAVSSPSTPCDGCVIPAWPFHNSIGTEVSSSLLAREAPIDQPFAGPKRSSVAASYRKRRWRSLARSCGSN